MYENMYIHKRLDVHIFVTENIRKYIIVEYVTKIIDSEQN